MADSNKPATHLAKKSRVAPPPWAKDLQPRRHTTTTPPARPTGSRRHIRNIPTRPQKASDMYSKKTRVPQTVPPKPTQSTTTPALDKPISKHSKHSKRIAINESHTLKRAPPSAPPGVPKVPRSVPMVPVKHPSIGSKPAFANFDVNDDAPRLQKSETLFMDYRWDNDMKTNYINTVKKPKVKQDTQRVKQEDVAKMYSKNIAGFTSKTLSDIERCNIDALLECMREGSECLRQFQSALTTFSKQQQTQCANFLKLFKKSKQRYAEMDAMPNFFYAISLIHSLLEETVKQSSQFAKFIQISCLPMIHELEIQCDAKYKELHTATKLEDKKLHDIHIDVHKLRKNTKNAAEKLIVIRRKDTLQQNEYKHKTHQKVTSTMNIISNISDILQTGLSTDVSIDDAYSSVKEEELKFKMAIAEYNAARLGYIAKRSQGKHEIINMEHFRVDSMLSVLQKIVNQQRKQYPLHAKDRAKIKLYQLQTDIVNHTQSVTAKDVVANFVHLSVETHGEWKPPDVIESKLGIEYRDMFHSIEDAMSITLEMNPNVKIPLIVPLLCERIRELNGFKTLGIFRKSPNRTEMLRYKKRLQGKVFELSSVNVHTYAGLLKEWLRGLKDLVIPKRYYDYCVDMAKANKLNKAQFEVFFSQLPHVNRECLKYLINFLRELLRPEYEKYTKMGLENIAIVFGPTLLMPPHELEPTVALGNAKSEKDFVISLIQNS